MRDFVPPRGGLKIRKTYLGNLYQLLSGNYSDLKVQLTSILSALMQGKLSKHPVVDEQLLATMISLTGIFNQDLEQSLTFLEKDVDLSHLQSKIESIVSILKGDITTEEL